MKKILLAATALAMWNPLAARAEDTFSVKQVPYVQGIGTPAPTDAKAEWWQSVGKTEDGMTACRKVSYTPAVFAAQHKVSYIATVDMFGTEGKQEAGNTHVKVVLKEGVVLFSDDDASCNQDVDNSDDIKPQPLNEEICRSWFDKQTIPTGPFAAPDDHFCRPVTTQLLDSLKNKTRSQVEKIMGAAGQDQGPHRRMYIPMLDGTDADLIHITYDDNGKVMGFDGGVKGFLYAWNDKVNPLGCSDSPYSRLAKCEPWLLAP